MFYSGEQNSVNPGIETAKLTLDTVTGSATDGFFLIQKMQLSNILTLVFQTTKYLMLTTQTSDLILALVVGATSYPIFSTNE